MPFWVWHFFFFLLSFAPTNFNYTFSNVPFVEYGNGTTTFHANKFSFSNWFGDATTIYRLKNRFFAARKSFSEERNEFRFIYFSCKSTFIAWNMVENGRNIGCGFIQMANQHKMITKLKTRFKQIKMAMCEHEWRRKKYQNPISEHQLSVPTNPVENVSNYWILSVFIIHRLCK